METIHDTRDNLMKLVMQNNSIYTQFIRDFSQNSLFANLQPEDIEDVSERFIPLVTDSQDADTVKKIRLPGRKAPVYIISLTEHQSSVRFDIALKLLQYMVYIWITYCKQNDKEHDDNKIKGVNDPTVVHSTSKHFRLPPILPIVYYDGEGAWTADRNFAERVYPQEGFKDFIPQFSYVLVDLNQYSREELKNYQSVMSLVMMLDKIRKPEDIEGLKEDAEPCLAGNPQPSELEILRQFTVMIMNKIGIEQRVIEETIELYEGRPPQMFEVLERNVKALRQETELYRQQVEQERWEKEQERREKEQERQKAERDRQKLLSIAIYFINSGKSVAETAQITGLSEEEITALKD
jgi:hypothetical protein